MKYRLYIPGTALLISSILAAPSSAMTARQLSIVPGADIVGNIAVREANASPIVKKRKAAQEMEGIQPRQSFEARRARFEAATGLTEDDVVAVSFSCDMDTANMKGLTQRDRMGALNGLVAVQLAKSISMKNIKQAVKLEYGSEDLAGVSDVNIGGQASLKVNASKPDDPDVYLTLTPDGRVLMAAFSADSLAAALGRCASGASLKEPENLARVRSILAPETQIQMACIVPPSVRAAIDEQLGAMRQQAAQNPGMAAMIGFSQLFSGIQNLCVGVQLDDDALISVAGSLGNVQAAQQASILLETMIIPMIQASMMKQSAGSRPADLENMVSVRTKDTALQVRLRLTEEQMMQKFMQAPAAPAAPATP